MRNFRNELEEVRSYVEELSEYFVSCILLQDKECKYKNFSAANYAKILTEQIASIMEDQLLEGYLPRYQKDYVISLLTDRDLYFAVEGFLRSYGFKLVPLKGTTYDLGLQFEVPFEVYRI